MQIELFKIYLQNKIIDCQEIKMQRLKWYRYHVYTGVIEKEIKEPRSLNDVTNTKSTLKRLISKNNFFVWFETKPAERLVSKCGSPESNKKIL